MATEAEHDCIVVGGSESVVLKVVIASMVYRRCVLLFKTKRL
jgi:hypothetical protein